MNKYISKIINLFAKQTAKKTEVDEFQSWLIDDEFSDEKEEALMELWNNTENKVTEDTFASLTSLKSKYKKQTNKKRTLFPVWKYAAAIAVILIGSTLYIATRDEVNEPNFIEYFTQRNETGELILPDSSIVRANAGTVILYNESFGKNNRTLYLSGEANFRVVRNEKMPFVVRSKDFAVTALGTEFNVASYPADNYYRTTLLSGKVKVVQNGTQTDYILNVNDQFLYDKQSGQLSVKQIDVYDETAWLRGELVISKATMKEVLDILGERYDVSFQYKSNVFGDDKYNFRFKKESSISDVLEIIKNVAEYFDYKEKDGSYYITYKDK